MELQEKTNVESENQDENREEETETSWIDSLKDPVFRRKLLPWLCLPILAWSLGMADALAGTINLDLQIITSVSEEKSTYFLTAFNLGYMLGSLLGGVWFGKSNSYFILSSTGCLAGVSAIVTPYCSIFAAMFILRCSLGFFLGIIICATNAEHIHIWGTKGEPLLQLIHAIYAVGGVVSPLMANPFLADKETATKTTPSLNSTPFTELTTRSYNSPNFVTDLSSSTISAWNNVTEPTTSTPRRTTEVHYALLILGIILIATSVPALVVRVATNKSSQSEEKEKVVEKHVNRKLPFGLNIFLVVCLFMFFFMYNSIEVTFTLFLKPFLEGHFEEVSSHEAAYVITYFWAAFAGCRFASILVSRYLRAARQLYMHYSLMAVAFTGFLVSSLFSRVDCVKAFSCIAGVACSANFASMISWTEAELMQVNGPISAVIMVGSSAGVTLVPIAVGELMSHFSKLWFCYCLMGSIVVTLSLFIFLLSFNRCYVGRKYGTLEEARQVRVQDDAEVTKSDRV